MSAKVHHLNLEAMDESKCTVNLAEVRSAIAAAGAPVPSRAFTAEEMGEAIGQALGELFGRQQ
jgi:hypothetical protein